MNFKLLNNIGGWLVFAIAFFTYFLTMEPTASFWDCGEFIACAYKLEVPHPAGAPFFLLLGRLFSLFAGSDVTKVAYFINLISVLSSAFTILFLFWTISLLARKVINKTADTLDSADIVKVLGASLVGSLIYTFSDTFWFSAVEAEVYAISSFFTAIVVWAAFRWELLEDGPAQNRWIIFIAYLVGLSIGVHLLNLVTLPALGLLYYFKKRKTHSFSGGVLAFFGGLVVLGIINVGLITGLPTIGFGFDKLFVNSFGLPFASGMLFFVVLLIAALVYGIYYSQKNQKEVLNTALLSFAFVLIGYSTYTIALIRSNYNPPINENNPSDVLNFTYYLKREQYGSRPLFYGPHYMSELNAINKGEAIYKVGKDKYEQYDTASEYEWSNKMLIPRLWSQDPSHVSLYRSKLNIAEGQKPTFGKNLKFLFSHQLGHMYWRYFTWNFWGRAGDISDAGGTNIFENNKDLPELYRNNKARTNFYGLPAILGILGLLYLFFKREKDFYVTLFLFLFTGLGLVFYLNSPPVEPRERDYIYVGSYFFFALWCGIGVLALADWAMKFIKGDFVRGAVASGVCLIIPIIMAKQSWAGHDRSNRVHQVDFAKNLLNSCAKNAILFTGGDNDTFPLWYAQEVEGFRTDVRVCNLSLLGTEWYIEQMKRPTYESAALPISLNLDNYYKGTNDQIAFYKNPDPNIQAGIELKSYLNLIKTNDVAIQMQTQSGEYMKVLPSSNFYFEQNPEEIKKMGFVSEANKQYVSNKFEWNFGERDILKNDLIMLDIIANNDWKRPIYFAGTLSTNSYLNLKEYCQLEGYTYRLMPFKVQGAKDGFVDTDVLAKNLDTKMLWRGLDDASVYYDSETYLKVPIITARLTFLRLVDQLIREDKKKEAVMYLDKVTKIMPDKSIPNDQIVANFPMFYYAAGEIKKGTALAESMVKRCDEELKYFTQKMDTDNGQWGAGNIQQIIQTNMRILNLLTTSALENDKPAGERFKKILDTYQAKLQ